jgi:hypothetical protein
MASTQILSSKNVLVAAIFAVMVVALLANDGRVAFDKVLGLAIIIPLSCVFTFVSGMLMGRIGMVIATALFLVWAIAVAIG